MRIKRFESELNLIFVVRIHRDSSHDTCIINERVSCVSGAEGMLLSRIPQPLYAKNDTDTTVMTKWIRLAGKIERNVEESSSWESFVCIFILLWERCSKLGNITLAIMILYSWFQEEPWGKIWCWSGIAVRNESLFYKVDVCRVAELSS